MSNQIQLSARVSSDISFKSTKKHQIPVADFRVVHKTRKVKNPLSIDIEVWGEEVNNIKDNIFRGDLVEIVGQLRRDIWVSKQTGETLSKLKITANKVSIISVGNYDSENSYNEQEQESTD